MTDLIINGCRVMNKKKSPTKAITTEKKIRDYIKVFAGDYFTSTDISLYLKIKIHLTEKILVKLVQEDLLVKSDKKDHYRRTH